MAKTARRTQYACEINGEYFASGAALRRRCRAILGKYLTDEYPQAHVSMTIDDRGFFVELVRLRDPGRVPAGTYIRDVIRTTREGQRGPHVAFVYGNGDHDFIGWSKMCDGGPRRKTQIVGALRESIRGQVNNAMCDAFGSNQYITCPKSGHAISVDGKWCDSKAIVHHEPPFADIVQGWLASEGVELDEVPLADLWCGGFEVAAGRLRDSWQAYHQATATLVVVSEKWHKEHHGKGNNG